MDLGFPLKFTRGTPVTRPQDPKRTFLTPNVNRLSLQSKRMWRMYSPSSICAPSRSSIFTGRNVGLNKIRTNWNSKDMPTYAELNETVASFAQTLQASADYETVYFGKWGLGATIGAPNLHGFENFMGFLREGINDELLLQFPPWLNTAVVSPDTNKTTSTTVYYTGNQRFPPSELRCAIEHQATCTNANIVFRNKALTFLRQRAAYQTRPFLLVWAPTTPHASEYSFGTKATSTTYNLAWRKGQFPPYSCKRGHAAQIEQHIDIDIGMLLNLLEANPSLDANTLLVFSSDNGPHADCKDDLSYTPNFFIGNGGLRGWKTYIYDGGLRVPTFVRWPGKVQPNTVSTAVQTLYDLQATFLDVAGLVPKQTGGVSLLPIWLKGDAYANSRPWAHFELCAAPKIDSSCSTGTLDTATKGHLWKLVVTPSSPQGELYDLLVDATEANNLASQLPDVLAHMWTLRNEARVPISSVLAVPPNLINAPWP